MKREIKFRGLRTDGKGWVYGSLVVWNDYFKIVKEIEVQRTIHGKKYKQLEDYSIIPQTLGQFTGLHDKNGVDIYEGDLMKYGKESFTVVFEPKYGYVAEFTKTNTNVCIPIYKFEIIGNIHQK